MDIEGKKSNTRKSSVNQTQGPRRTIAVLLLIIGGILILFGSVLAAAWYVKENNPIAPVQPDSSKYQAVFMTNGQVYFGKLTDVSSKYQVLTDVYYLQVQDSSKTAAEATSTDADASQIALTKLGSELHAPTDRMNIASDQVLFWEDLKDESAVVKAIETHKSEEK